MANCMFKVGPIYRFRRRRGLTDGGAQRKTTRTAVGSGILEGVVGLQLVTIGTVLMVMLLINVSLVTSYCWKLQVIAAETARFVQKQQYWIGVERPDFDRVTAMAQARVLANSLLNRLGLPNASRIDIVFDGAIPGLPNMLTSVVTVTITIDRLPTIGRIFVPFISMSGTGISAEESARPFAVCTQVYQDPGGVSADWRFVTFPIYKLGHLNATSKPTVKRMFKDVKIGQGVIKATSYTVSPVNNVGKDGDGFRVKNAAGDLRGW